MPWVLGAGVHRWSLIKEPGKKKKSSYFPQRHCWISQYEKAVAPHSSTLAWKIPWMEEPGRLHGVAKSRARLRDFTFTLHFHALEKEMATPSRVLAWRIPETEEPGGLPSMGSHRVGHDWSDLAAAAIDSERASLEAQMVKSLPAVRSPRFKPWVWKILWRREWQPTPVFLPGKFRGQRGSRCGTVHRVAKSQRQSD